MKNRPDIYAQLMVAKERRRKQFAVLLDPDHLTNDNIPMLVSEALAAEVDILLIGGSLVMCHDMNEKIAYVKSLCNLPLIIFPGGMNQICAAADAILLLSLVSGRNPDLLIGQHVLAAPMLRKSGLDILSTGYILIDGGAPTTVSYISQTYPIPADKAAIALCTAMAAEMLGMKLIYLDAGSGAQNAISEVVIRAVSQNINIPLIVGGGIRTPEEASKACQAGADIIVVGNILEKDPTLMGNIARAIHDS